MPEGQQCSELVSLTDLFAIATRAAGVLETRDGIDVIGLLKNQAETRTRLIGMYGIPGTPRFKVMLRHAKWKYIFIANGGRELLFNLEDDPDELQDRSRSRPDVAEDLKRQLEEMLAEHPNSARALDRGELISFPFEARALRRIIQMDTSQGITGFPQSPGNLLET